MQATHTQAQKTIEGIAFPVRRDRIVAYARRGGADDELLHCLEQLPEREYHGPNEVGAAFADVFGT
jgi:hypothetical protein